MNKCPKCPYYEQTTSYGTECIECYNEDCQNRKEPVGDYPDMPYQFDNMTGSMNLQ